MVTELLLAAVIGTLQALLGLLPSWEIPSWMAYEPGGVAFQVGAILYKVGMWLPIDEIGTGLVVVGGLFIPTVTVMAFLWIWAMLPVVGKKG